MITYIVTPKKNPKTEVIKYYAQIAPIRPLRLDDIAEKISNQCTVTEHDVKAVLSALQEQVLMALREGNSVRLGDLGSFRPTISSDPSDAAADVTADNIKTVRVRYTMSARLRSSLAKGQRGVRFGTPNETKTETGNSGTGGE